MVELESREDQKLISRSLAAAALDQAHKFILALVDLLISSSCAADDHQLRACAADDHQLRAYIIIFCRFGHSLHVHLEEIATGWKRKQTCSKEGGMHPTSSFRTALQSWWVAAAPSQRSSYPPTAVANTTSLS